MTVPSPPNQHANGEVPALRKGLLLLDLLATEDALSTQEIQERTELNKTMTFRLLRTLKETGYVTQNVTTRKYSLGLKLLELGRSVSERHDVVSASLDILENLRETYFETINLGAIDGNIIRYLAIAESRHGLRLTSRVGSQDYAHSTSIGKAILAFQSDAERARLLDSLDLVARTAQTITNRQMLEAELRLTRDRGFAIDDEENEAGARCIGVPILDHRGTPIAGISMAGPSSRIAHDRVHDLAQALWAASRAISGRLSWTPVVASAAGATHSPRVRSGTMKHGSQP